MTTPRKRILVVDDDPRILEVVAFLLSREGHEVRIAGTGAEAIDLAREHAPDLILMDVTMPEMDGFEACRRITLEPPLQEVPVLFLTAKTGPTNWSQANHAGAVAYMEKPFRNESLLALVREILSRGYQGTIDDRL